MPRPEITGAPAAAVQQDPARVAREVFVTDAEVGGVAAEGGVALG